MQEPAFSLANVMQIRADSTLVTREQSSSSSTGEPLREILRSSCKSSNCANSRTSNGSIGAQWPPFTRGCRRSNQNTALKQIFPIEPWPQQVVAVLRTEIRNLHNNHCKLQLLRHHHHQHHHQPDQQHCTIIINHHHNPIPSPPPNQTNHHHHYLQPVLLLLLLLLTHASNTFCELSPQQAPSNNNNNNNNRQQHFQQLPSLLPQPAPNSNHQAPTFVSVAGQNVGGLDQGQAAQQAPLPPLPLERPMRLAYYQGPGLDLASLNRRRFELGHNHHKTSHELGRGEMIESNLATVPDHLLGSSGVLPDNLNRQILDSLAGDSTLVMSPTNLNPGPLFGEVAPQPLPLPPLQPPPPPMSAHQSSDVLENNEDPDGDSIDRLTKSCLTVQASSSTPEQLNVTFHLYTKSNPQIPFILKPQVTRMELIKSSPFDPSKPIKWITHGFHTNVDKSEWMVEAKDKILTFEDANVILTDWRRGAWPALSFYPKAAANAHVVAKMIVRILRRLRNDIDFSQIHLIGHSLGAHIMGFVGSDFTEEHLQQQQQLLMLRSENQPFWRDIVARQTGSGSIQLIGRITACDPALPCFGPTSLAPQAPQASSSSLSSAAASSSASSSSSPLGTTLASTQVATPVDSSRDVWSSQAQAQAQAQQQVGSGELPAQNRGMDNGASLDLASSLWTHLRPDSAVIVEVMHSNPGVMGYADPLGDYDFYPNGFERQPGCGVSPQSSGGSIGNNVGGAIGHTAAAAAASLVSGTGIGNELQAGGKEAARRRTPRQLVTTIIGSVISLPQQTSAAAGISQTIDRFIKPIRDFFRGYTCSHHRAVEYMVESMYYEQVPYERKLDRDFVCQMVGYRCSDYLSFKKGFCFRCLSEHDCRAFTMSRNTINPFTSEPGFQPPNLASQQQFGSSPVSRSLRVLAMEKFKLADEVLQAAAAAASLSQSSPSSPQSPASGPDPSLSASGPTSSASTHSGGNSVATSAGSPSAAPSLSASSITTVNTQSPNSQTVANSSPFVFVFSTSNATTDENKNITSNNNNNNTNNKLKQVSKQVVKRVLPSLTYHNQNYLPQRQNQYYFDTRHAKEFCLHHYHVYVKYRWLRVRDEVAVDGFRLMGTLANITQRTQVTFHRYTHRSYTMLLTESVFLGQIGSLLVYGEKIKPALVEHIEVTYMSNLDPNIRALGSARLCRSEQPANSAIIASLMDPFLLAGGSHSKPNQSSAALFVRCAGLMV